MPAHRPIDPAHEKKLFFDGIHLFNSHEFFEAHEVWEDAWRSIPRPPRGQINVRREFYQGLIQCAVALEHYRRSNPRGVVSLYDSYRRHFKAVPDRFMGLHVQALLAAMRRALAPVLDADPLPQRGQSTLDLATAPRIELDHDPFAAGDAAHYRELL